MKSFSTARFLVITATLLSLAACGQGIPVLPDDPQNESTAVELPENQEATQLPSETADLPVEEEPAVVLSEREEILKLYDYVDPQHVVPTQPLEEALIYFHKNKSSFKNQTVISIIDFSKKSTQKRWHFVDMKTGEVWSLHVSHGKGSDSNHDGYAEKFSNVSGSNASSLGFYRTAETYSGSNGYSLRLDGLSSTNSNARARAIVVHGASYVQDSNVIQGRSYGCPAISAANHQKVINLIKGGSLIYAVN
ncbi:MAG: murein L,D-transpeptidase catalytic domain family protein [Bdellovibrio sp.]